MIVGATCMQCGMLAGYMGGYCMHKDIVCFMSFGEFEQVEKTYIRAQRVKTHGTIITNTAPVNTTV